MTPAERVTKPLFYQDKRIEDCTREELLKAVRYLAERLEQQQQWHRENLEMEQLFRKALDRI